jgi:hypothetical protein
MNPDAYVKSIISKYALLNGRTLSATAAAQHLYEIIKVWADKYLIGVNYSG